MYRLFNFWPKSSNPLLSTVIFGECRIYFISRPNFLVPLKKKISYVHFCFCMNLSMKSTDNNTKSNQNEINHTKKDKTHIKVGCPLPLVRATPRTKGVQKLSYHAFPPWPRWFFVYALVCPHMDLYPTPPSINKWSLFFLFESFCFERWKMSPCLADFPIFNFHFFDFVRLKMDRDGSENIV